MNSLFVVESPLQFLNAMEARYQLAKQSKSFLIILQGVSDKNLQQIEALIEKTDWYEIYILRNTNNRWKYRKPKQQLDKIIKDCAPTDIVFIGEYRSILMRHVANKCNANTKYLLDDGNYSLYAQQKLIAKNGEYETYSIVRKIYDRMLGLQDQDMLDINFFSVYDLNINSSTEARFVRNKYSRIKGSLSNKDYSEHVLFIGNNTPEIGVLSEHYYLEYLDEIKEYYEGRKIMYVPHRRENQEKLNQINKRHGFEICILNRPVELFLLEEASLPYRVSSFFSSALDNCTQILGSKLKIDSFYVPENKILLEEYKERVKLSYQVYRSYKTNFQIIEL